MPCSYRGNLPVVVADEQLVVAVVVAVPKLLDSWTVVGYGETQLLAFVVAFPTVPVERSL